MFDLSLTKLLVLAVIALVVFGPHELPKIAAQAGRALRDLRRIAEGAKADLREGLGPEFQDFDFEDLNPRRFVQKHLLDDMADSSQPLIDEFNEHAGRGPRRYGDGDRGRHRRRERHACHPARRRRSRPSTSRPPERLASCRSRAGASTATGVTCGLRLSIRPARPRPLLASDSATLASWIAAGADGSARTSGLPLSPPSRSRTSSGIWPSSGTSTPVSWVSAVATVSPPPEPKTSIASPQCGQSRYDMFSITPMTRWWVCVTSVPARLATSAAATCGVVTMTSSAPGTSLARESATSPVPGGMSMSR